MALQADAQGFLIGETVAYIKRAGDALSQIRTDIAEIRRAFSSSSNSNRESGNSPSSSGGSNPRISSVVATPSGAGNGNQNASSSLLSLVSSNGVATPNGRSRDTSGNEQATGAGSTRDRRGGFTSNNEGNAQAQRGDINGLPGRVVAAVKASSTGVEEVDPAIKAFKEVAEPMKRGYQLFSSSIGGKKGGGDKKESWFRKIFGELKLLHKDETVFSRAANRSLHNIEGNPVGGGGDNGDSSGGMMLLIGGMLARLGPLLLTGITGVLGFIFSPIGLAIGAAAAVAWGLFTEEGQKFFGEVGAKVIAGWDTVVAAFTPVSESISKGWDTVKGGFDSLITGMVTSWDTFTGFLKCQSPSKSFHPSTSKIFQVNV